MIAMSRRVAIWVKGESQAMTARLRAAIAESGGAFADAEFVDSWTGAHMWTERNGGLILRVSVRAEWTSLDWGRPIRDDMMQRTVEWLSRQRRETPRSWDPQAETHSGQVGASVVNAAEVAHMVGQAYAFRPDVDLVETLRDAARRTAETEAALLAVRAERDAAVRAAIKGNVPVQTVEDMTGLSRPRVYQITNSPPTRG